MLDFNIINALLIIIGVVVFIKFAMPYLKKNNIDMYEEVKLALLLFGYSFRDEKVKALSNMILEIVNNLEKLSITPDEKHYLAVDEVFRRLLDEFDIEIEETAIELLIRIAVATLPPTNAN